MKYDRIVAALDPRFLGPGPIEVLAELAQRSQAEFVGLFIEDIELLHLAALPFAREIGFPSAARRDLDVGRMESSLEALALRWRRACEAALEGSTVSWSFRVARGRRTEQMVNAAKEVDRPTLLVPPGADPRAQPQVISRRQVDEDRIGELVKNAGRPIFIVP